MDRFQEENSYSTIFKRISAFGGVQVFNILVTLVRGKFVALFLGPEGMGISSLFTSSTSTLQHFGSLGLNLALVKEVAASRDDRNLRSRIIGIALRLIVLTSILGGLACMVLSPWLSYWSFGNYGYTGSFLVLGIFVALSIGGAGLLSLLQGMAEVKRLSRASLVGGLTGLFVGVPLYYFFGNNGIVPAMVLMGLTMFLFYYISFRQGVDYDKADIKLKSHTPLIRKLLSLGFVLMVGTLVGTAVSFAINAYIRAYGDIDNVGLFQAANSLTNQYIGIVFSAMAMDYFPRLSAVVTDPAKMRMVANRQAEVVILMVTPLVLLLMVTAPWVIQLFLSKEFLAISDLVRWLGAGVLLQAVSFPLAYLFVAGNNKKAYIWIEIVMSNIVWLACSVGLYYCFSLIGLGISLVVRTGIDIVVDYIVVRKTYGFQYTRECLRTLAVCLSCGTAGFIFSVCMDSLFNWYVLAVCLLSITYSLIKLKKKLSQSRMETTEDM